MSRVDDFAFALSDEFGANGAGGTHPGLIPHTPVASDRRSSRIALTGVAQTRLPDACAALFEGNREALSGFTDEEAAQLVALLTRVIANLDRVANAEASPHNP